MARKFQIEAVFKAIDRVTRPMRKMQARIQRVTRGITKSLRRVDKLTSRVARGLGTGMKRGAMIATGAIIAMGVAINRVTADIDTLAKRAKQLDFPIEELQEWRFVGEQSGLTTDMFDKSIKKFTKTLGEARAGYGTMSENLKKNNKPLLKLLRNTDNVAEAFDIYIDTIRKTPNAMDAAALATTAFGRAGQEMVIIARTSADEVSRLRQEQRENGVITMKQAAIAEAYNDAMNSLKRSMGGFIQGALLPMLPLLTEGVRAFRKWIVANRELMAQKVLEFFRMIVANFDKIVKGAKDIGKGIAAFFALSASVKVLIGVMEVLNIVMAANPIGLIVVGVMALVGALVAAFVWGKKIAKFFGSLPAPIKLFVASIVALSGPFAVIGAALVLLRVHFEKVKAVAIPVFKAIGRGAVKAAEWIDAAWVPVQDVIDEVIATLVKAPAAISAAWAAVSSGFVSTWNAVVDAFETAINYIVNTGPISWLIAGVLLIRRNWEPIVDFFTRIWSVVKMHFVVAIQETMDGPVAWLMSGFGLLRDAWNGIVGYYAAMWDGTKGEFSTAINWIINGPVKWLKDAVQALEFIWRPVVDVFKDIWDGVTGVFQSAVDKISVIVSPVLGFFKKIQAAKDAIIKEDIGEIKIGGRIEKDIAAKVPNVIEVDFKKGIRVPQSGVPQEPQFTRILGNQEQQAQEDREQQAFKPQLVSGQERIIRSLEESRTREESEVTIRDETNRAEVTKGKLGGNVKLKKTGTFK